MLSIQIWISIKPQTHIFLISWRVVPQINSQLLLAKNVSFKSRYFGSQFNLKFGSSENTCIREHCWLRWRLGRYIEMKQAMVTLPAMADHRFSILFYYQKFTLLWNLYFPLSSLYSIWPGNVNHVHNLGK